MSKRFGVIGGDRRQAELARFLRQDGHDVLTYDLHQWLVEEDAPLEEALKTEVVILPLPLCKEQGILHCQSKRITTKELFQQLTPKQLVLAGQVHPKQKEEAAGLDLVDYFLREELTVANAAATAEATIQVAMEHLNRMILGMNCLVLGFGRIGKLLAHRLQGMGAKVTATARKPEDLAWIRAYGFSALESNALDGKLEDFDAVFNTIPSLILNTDLVEQLKSTCLCVDVASVPGIDLAKAEARRLPQIWARALPGRMVPVTAAQVIRDAIYYILKERGDPV